MIKQIPHTVTAAGAADLPLALDVAYELHAPAAPPRAPEVAAPQAPHLMGLRTPPTRTHARKVPLKRLTTLRG